MGNTSPVVKMSDVSRRAGVGMATVSRAINGHPGVSEKTRRRVLEVAEELGYVPSPEASKLARGSTRRIAILAPHLSRWFFATMLGAVEPVIRHAGYDTLVYQVPDARARHDFFEHLPARRKVDGVIVIGLPVTDAERRRLDLLGVQIVAAGGQTADFPFVRIDDANAARQAVNHLISLGHTRIGMIEAVDPDSPEWPEHLGRSDGYREAISAAGIPPRPDLTVRVPWGGEDGARAMATLLSLPEPPTAVYAHSDEVAFGAMRTIRRAGLSIPDDISIIGIDDHPTAALVELTTVRQPVPEQGEAAANLLLDLLNHRDTRLDVTMATTLVPRGSTTRLREPATTVS